MSTTSKIADEEHSSKTISAPGKTPISPSSASIPNSAGTSSSSSSRVPSTPRRSLAHNPRLLGLSGDVPMELRGVTSSTTSTGSHPHASGTVLFESQELGDDDDYDEEGQNRPNRLPKEESKGYQGQSRNAEMLESHKKPRSGHSLAPIRIDSYGGQRGYQVEQDEESAILSFHRNETQVVDESRDIEQEAASYDSDSHKDDLQQYTDDLNDDEQTDGLLFEPTTRREKSWMWISVGLVATLTFVSIAIAVDWIDWPGDGIGKD